MVRILKHKQEYKTELQEANIMVHQNKYNFSKEFAEKLYKFSEEHHKDHFKTFNKALAEWMETQSREIATEIAYIKESGFDGPETDIYQKIKISARFYYRKKTKREKANPKTKKEKKPYIGLSNEFIFRMDEYIKGELLQHFSCNQQQHYIHQDINMNKSKKRKTLFAEFTQANISHIQTELICLKDKYDEEDVSYEPTQIADKFKKAFENRFYTFAHMC
jgi:hypothetical protein